VTDDSLKYRQSLQQHKMSHFVAGPIDGKFSKSSALKVLNSKDEVVAEKAL